MTLTAATTRVQRMSENAWLTVLGRLTIVLGIPLLLVLVGWQLTKQDRTQDAVDDLSTRMTRVETTVGITSIDLYHNGDAKRDLALRDARILNNSDKLIDHEARLKALELERSRR